MADGAITITLPADMDPVQRDDIMEALDLSGAALDIATAETAPEANVAEQVEAQLESAVMAADELPEKLSTWWQAFSAANDGGPILGLALIAVLLVGAYAAERLVMMLIAGRFRPTAAPDALFSVRLRGALRWAAGRALSLFLFYVFVRLGANLILPQHTSVALPVGAIGWAVFNARIFYNVVEFLTGSRDARRRMTPLSDEDGAAIRRATMTVLLVFATVSAASNFLSVAGLPARLFVLALTLLLLVIVFSYFFKIRRPVAQLIRDTFQEADGSISRGVAIFAGGWHLIYALFSLLNNGTRISGLLIGADASATQSTSYTFFVLMLTPFLIGACDALFGEWMERMKAEDDAARAKARDEAAAAAQLAADQHAEAVAKAEAEGVDPPAEPQPIEFEYESDVADRIGAAAAMKALGHGLVLITATMLVLFAWDVDPFTRTGSGFAGKVIPSLVSAMAVMIVGWSVWKGVAALIDMKIPQSDEEEEDASGEGFGKQGSRLETVMPVIRMVAMAVIWTVAIMTALSAMGISIGPLLAGAGVVGLAVGFGAQQMVKDVISGALYLYEDAFRVGEYVIAGPGKGVVEKISLRSVVLRHHRGPVYTIPFGDLGTIQNHSRDWVKIKFELHVPHDTDVEKVRKLIKKVGQGMLANEQYGHHFIAPVKSQGVVRVDDLGFVIGVKFMSKPGEQFLIRRDAYTKIKAAFAENGIEFSTPRVFVDSGASEEENGNGEGQGSAAGGGAAAAALSPQMQTTPTGGAGGSGGGGPGS